MASLNDHETRIVNLENKKILPNSGRQTAITGTTDLPRGLSLAEVYNNGYPCSYGNVINLGGIGMGQILVEWSGSSGAKGGLFFRSQRDVSDANWSDWSRVWTQGEVITNACWNDYAEKFEKHPNTIIEPGDIVVLDTENDKEIYRLSRENDNCIAGVCSDEYGFVLGGTENKEYDKNNFCVVGLVGRVKTKVIGTIKKGDRIVPSNIEGIGRVYNPNTDSIFSIIGYATEDNDNPNIKRVRVKLSSL